MEIIVVYELDRPGAAEAPVRRVHAAPGAPGTPSSPGPRTFCGKDTFAMGKAPWRPAEHPDAPWYPPEYADRLCESCDSAMEDES
ncbi:hypothetical protein I5Q34_07700 [Streptomyces sp. AV19]|uniref:hypothetical protein n=1 Tax=Streptomyces sp. AV19 TaxID=2793068 RepID=UPI0018FEB3D5|nr:hypothetical protein [Streptomyces sp. AV19]MBH1934181.1 hypothetical protein [Streptomyces sp. AV19]MDG4533556.1 hypothetical protein [Streptomyces sp. AV19]